MQGLTRGRTVDVLQERRMAQNVATHRDDVSVLALGDRAHLVLDLHVHRRPIGGGSDRLHQPLADFDLSHRDTQRVDQGLTSSKVK